MDQLTRALSLAVWRLDYTPRPGCLADERYEMARAGACAVVEAIAENVSDEMVYQFILTEKALKGSTEVDPLYAAIAAAVRAALNPDSTPKD